MKLKILLAFLSICIMPTSISSYSTCQNLTIQNNIINQPKKASVESQNQSNIMSADILIATEKPEVLENLVPKSPWNMVTKKLTDNSVEYFYFNEHDYSYRQFAYDDNNSRMSNDEILKPAKVGSLVNSDGSVSSYTNGYNPLATLDNVNTNITECGIIGDDDRVMVQDSTQSPYRFAGYIKITYNNVYNKTNGVYESRSFTGTAFLEGPDLLVTAGHCVYGDVTNDGDYQDNVSNPRFADEIRFYPAQNGSSRPYGFIDVERVFLEDEYYLNVQKDWACCKLEEPIGNQIGWLGKISNFYQKDYSMMTFGYPGDKDGYMYKTIGNMTSFESNGWYYRTNIDQVGGQSGSPYQVTVNGGDFICGIATYESSDSSGPYTGGCRIDGFMFAFLNSFVTSFELPEYLPLFVNSKSGNTWNIRIFNPNSFKITAYYNSEMCFYSDAENWSNLKNVKDVSIEANGNAYVNISENWFATTIAVSFMYGSKRLISFADKLDSGNKTLSLHQNLIQ